MKLTNLNFHQTMPPNVKHLSRLLNSDVFEKSLSKEEISQLTGIPTGKSSGKVEPHIAYAEYMGLITDNVSSSKHTLKLTNLGMEVLRQDPSLVEDVTLMVCYLNMTSKHSGASLWETIMGELLPQYTRPISIAVIMDALKKEASSNINLSPFYSSMETEFFSPLNLFIHTGDSIQISKHKYNSELLYVYAYSLLKEWENEYPIRDELTANELREFIMPACIGWKENDLYTAMEYMQEKTLLSFNRQLVPYTITKHVHSNELISRLYSELC